MSNRNKTQFNGAVLILAKIIKNVMASAAKAEVSPLYLNTQKALAIQQCPIELGHSQPPTPLKIDNVTARGILTGTIKQICPKAMDRHFYWLKDRTIQGQFDIFWEPGKHNLADYPTKHHSGAHHCAVRPIYLYNKNSQGTLKGCIEILTRDSNNPGPTKTITQSDGTQLVQTHGANNMTHKIKSNRTKHARTHVSTDKKRRPMSTTRVTRPIRARAHIWSDTQQQHTQIAPLLQ